MTALSRQPQISSSASTRLRRSAMPSAVRGALAKDPMDPAGTRTRAWRRRSARSPARCRDRCHVRRSFKVSRTSTAMRCATPGAKAGRGAVFGVDRDSRTGPLRALIRELSRWRCGLPGPGSTASGDRASRLISAWRPPPGLIPAATGMNRVVSRLFCNLSWQTVVCRAPTPPG